MELETKGGVGVRGVASSRTCANVVAARDLTEPRIARLNEATLTSAIPVSIAEVVQENHGGRVWPGQKGAHHAFHRQPLTKHEVEPGSACGICRLCCQGGVRCSKE